MEVLGRLTKVQYWNWRYRAKELEAEELKLQIQREKLEKQHKDLEIMQLKFLMAKGAVRDLEEKQVNKKKEFSDFIDTLEAKLGFKLRDAAIDDYTLEVKKLD